MWLGSNERYRIKRVLLRKQLGKVCGCLEEQWRRIRRNREVVVGTGSFKQEGRVLNNILLL